MHLKINQIFHLVSPRFLCINRNNFIKKEWNAFNFLPQNASTVGLIDLKVLTKENSEILFEVNKYDYEKTYLFIKNNRKYILDLKWLSAHSKEYARFNNNLYEFVINLSKKTKFPQNDISFMITSVMAVCINLGDEMLTRSDVSPDDASNFATKLFLKGL